MGTRKSALALVQTELVRKELLKIFPGEEIRIVPIVTKGDRELGRSLASFGGKGVFIQELEEKLLNGEIDMAVHSAKDIPMELAPGLVIGAALKREDPRDVLVKRRGAGTRFDGCVIGTSSLRRELQIKRQYPHAEIRMLRGNVPTRLQKLRDRQYDGILLAAAGLKRLGLLQEPDLQYDFLDTDSFLPAAGQGILAVETREGAFDEAMRGLNDPQAETALFAEREFLRQLGGSCNAPCGVLCRNAGKKLRIQGMYVKPSSETATYAEVFVEQTGPAAVTEGIRELVNRLGASGFVSLVGAGPGRKESITVQALECVRRADVILYDNLISPSILNEAALSAELIYVGKRAGAHAMRQEQINKLLIRYAQEGCYVVRLKGGDPFVFGRGGEEAAVLKQQGIPFDVVSGVSSCYSVPAAEGIPVTHRDAASSLHIITGHEGADKAGQNLSFEALANERGTLVFLMGLRHIGEITEKLILQGKAPDTPAAVISNGLTARQRCVCGTLENIAGLAGREKLSTPAVIVIGEVVSEKQNMGRQSVLPLSGKRILFTGTRKMAEQLEQAFMPFGAECIALSLIETTQLQNQDADRMLQNVKQYQWIVFTSASGVKAFFDRLAKLWLDRRMLCAVRFAVVGTSTEQELEKYGYFADFVPSVFTSRQLALEWTAALSGDESVLLVRGTQGARHLEHALAEREISFDCAELYETRTDYRRKDELQRVCADVDYVIVTSGSGARALAEMLPETAAQIRVAAIGPETAKACRQAGLTVCVTAKKQDAAGIAQTILEM
ncbi:MAG: uroporphyrinogen-III C-methyltransferase [Clostridiaceae bacterium]|nr:uroporphyrinogen-III C-methyltransferase [Clostridiaceae bacterium]